MEMVICPSCKSTRIRDDYKPAPAYCRAIGIRALLCDHCNRQFRAFSPVISKSPARDHYQHKANVFNPAPAIDLNRLNGNSAGNGQKEAPTMIRLYSFKEMAHQEPPVPGELLEPIPRNLRTQITKLNQERADIGPDHARIDGDQRKRTLPLCPNCGSKAVRQRHRKVWERALFSFTEHKAFLCRACDGTFYARIEKLKSDSEDLDVPGTPPH